MTPAITETKRKTPAAAKTTEPGPLSPEELR
jgi:hypothetical protein